MKPVFRTILTLMTSLAAAGAFASAPAYRPPAVPLVTHDPYFSVWSCADQLHDVPTTHWTRTIQPMNCLVRINGKAFRLMGATPEDLPVLPQQSVKVLPTRTIYQFANQNLRVTMTFLAASLPSDLDLMSRPVTYVLWDVVSLDGARHRVELYYDVAPELVVNKLDQTVEVSTADVPGLDVLRMGTVDQPVLQKSGDGVRIDWGHLYVGLRPNLINQLDALDGARARETFVQNGRLPLTQSETPPLSVAEGAPVIAAVIPLGNVGMLNQRSRAELLLAYDDQASIRYFGQDLEPYWRAHGMDAVLLLDNALSELDAINKQCEAFDERFMRDMTRVGGLDYARVAALAYRQTLAGCKLVADAHGAPLLFPKENHSNGCIGTVDVIHPMIPLQLLFSPALAKAAVVPVLDYASSPRWTFPFAPHDLGTYPHATGQVYGGGETSEDGQMPVEETANMLLLMAGIAKAEGTTAFADRYWPLLTQWAAYLKETGWDPGEQLCTDDFTGPLGHNVNLSAKAICALGAFGQLNAARGDADAAEDWLELARSWVNEWVDAAYDNGHYRLAFDQPGTWSQKYNLAWDRVLGLGLFPSNVLREEMDHYLRQQLPYGLPLDSRATFTKLDWIFWTACLTDDRDDRDRLLEPVYRFVHETFDRVPMTDWYMADTGRRKGFQARPVVGAVFMPALLDASLWKAWSDNGENYVGEWAPFPVVQDESPADADPQPDAPTTTED